MHRSFSGQAPTIAHWQLVLLVLLALVCAPVFAAPPVSVQMPQAEDLVGESFCFDASLSSGGTTGFGPYYQVITKPGYSLSSATFLNDPLTIISEGTFPLVAPLELTDSLISQTVTGPAGGELNLLQFPIGSVVAGQPALVARICLDVDSAEVVDVLQADAFELVPVFRFGDTATGSNGPEIGTRDSYDFTPRLITYDIANGTAEMERPPGPAWTWDFEVTANIASDRTVTPIDFNSISPITLPPNVQFQGPVTFAGAGVNCTAVTPDPPPGGSPGGTVTLQCDEGTGTIGNDQDITVTFPVYIVDTLDENSCSDGASTNTAKHVTIQKSVGGSGLPGATLTYTLGFSVSEFVDGIPSLTLVDEMPDGLTFQSATVTYGGSTGGIVPTVANDTPGDGQTRVTYDVTATTGALAAGTGGFVTYTATIDQTYDAPANLGEPLRARDDLNNTVTGTYDIQNGASNCSDNSNAQVTIEDITASKVLVSPADGLVQAGDTVTWRLRLNVPSGDVQGIVFTDFFPIPVIDVTTISTVSPIGSNPNISFGPNNTGASDATSISRDSGANSLTINFQDITSTTTETIEVDVSVVVSDKPFADDLELSNVLQVVTDNTGVDQASGIQTSSVRLQQPVLEMTKTVSGSETGYEAGDTVVFDLVAANTGSAPAYNVRMVDTLPAAGFTGCSVTGNTGGSGAGDVFGAGYEFSSYSGVTGDALDPGDTVALEVSCVFESTVANNTAYTNTASVDWAAADGADRFPPVEDDASARTRQAQVFKEIVATSEAHTSEVASPRPLVTGEIVRYRAWSYIPQGRLSSVALRDILPSGLQYVPGETFIALLSNSAADLTASGLACDGGGSPALAGDDSTDLSTLALTCEVIASSGGASDGSDVFFTLGTVDNTEADANEELVVIELNARVVGSASSGASLNNVMRLNTSAGNPQSSAVTAVQQVPALDIGKTVNPTTADANDRVEYVITVAHTDPDSDVTAYDIALNDIVPAGMTYDSAAGITGPQPPAAPGGDTCTIAGLTVDDSTPGATPGLSVRFDALALGDVCEIRFFATTNGDVMPGQTLTNSVSLGYSSLPGNGTAVNPTNSAPGAEGTYSGSAEADLSIQGVELNKSIVSTSIGATPDGTADTNVNPRPLVIGETARYRLQMRLPEGDADDFVVTDLLPVGLQYVANSARIALVSSVVGQITAPAVSCTSGSLNQTGDESTVAAVSPNCALEPTGGPFAAGTDPVWDLGDLMNADMDANQEFVLIEFDAVVLDSVANRSGTSLENSYELSLDAGATTTTSNSVFAATENPDFGVAKRVTAGPSNNADGTYTLTYQLVLANGGSYAVSGVQVTDSLATTFPGMTVVVDALTSPTLGVNTPAYNGAGDVNLLTAGQSLAANSSHTIDLTVTVTPGNNFGTFNNTATATASLPGGTALSDTSDNGASPDGDGDGDPTNDSDVTPVTLGEDPELGVAKTISAGPSNLGDGTYSLSYSIYVENSGDVNLTNVSLTEDLAAVFADASAFSITSLTSSDLAVNASGFTGIAPNQNLLASGVTLEPGDSGTVVLAVTITPGSDLGPYLNTVTGSGTAPSGALANDVSDDGTDPDGNGDGDPGNDSETTPVTFAEGPEIGLAKTILAGPDNQGDGTYTLTYRLLIENTGDVLLNNVTLVDDLATTFADAAGFAVNSVTSSDIAVNSPGYDGSAVTNLLPANVQLAAGASGTIDVALTVTPGSDLGPYNNTAEAGGQSPAGATVNDISDNGTVTDGDGNGTPGNDSDVTPVSFGEMPLIGVAKVVQVAPVNNGDGTFDVSYRLFVENYGDVALRGVQVTDDLAAAFADASSFAVQSLTATGLTASGTYTGSAPNIGLLDASDTLASGAQGTIDLVVRVTPGADLGPYNNSASAQGTAPSGATANDDSQAGSDPDSNGNGDPTDDTGPTPVSFVEGVSVGLAKTISSGPVNNGDGTFTLTYQFRVENTGEIVVSSVQVNDDLAATFAGAAGFAVNNVTSSTLTVNPGYTGIAPNQGLLTGVDSIPEDGFGTIELEVTVTPGGTLGPYSNVAVVNAQSPAGDAVADTSDDGTVVDQNGNGDATDDSDPTPVTFAEDAGLGLAKQVTAGPVNNGDGTYTLTYRLLLENTGEIQVNGLQLEESLATTFAGAAAYTISNRVASAGLTLDPAFDGGANSSLLAGTDTLPVDAAETVDLTLIVTPGANLGPYNNSARVTGTTPGGVALDDVSDDAAVVDENGNGDPGDDGDPTPVSFAEDAVLGIAKAVTGAPVNNEDGSYGLVYTLILENLGDVALQNLAVTDDLAATFAGAAAFTVDNLSSPTLTVNPAYTGLAGASDLLAAGNTLAVAATAEVVLELTITPGANFGPYNNSAAARGTAPSGAVASDDSTDGVDADPNGNNDPTEESVPTPVTFAENALIGLAKTAVSPSVPNYDGTFTSAVTLLVENLGDVRLDSVVVSDDIASNIAPATVVSIANLVIGGDLTAVNAGFDGIGNIDITDGSEALGVGESATISFDLTYSPNDNLGPFNNQAQAAAQSPGNPNPGVANVLDDSTDGGVPDANGDGDPGNDSVPTPMTFVAGTSCTVTMPAEVLPGAPFTLRVADSDSFYDAAAVDTLTVTVVNQTTAESEAVLLTETGAASGEFSGALLVNYDVSTGANDDGVLLAQNADIISATYTDPLTATGGTADCTASGELLGLATLEGNAWLDADTDDQFDGGERALEGWIVEVYRDGVLVASVPVDATGGFSVPDLIPGNDYAVSLLHPVSGAVFGEITNIDLPPQVTVLDQNLPIDPSGVFYDSVTREPVQGVQATLVNSSGTPLPQSCLLAGQQNQVTDSDGLYRFDVIIDADPACASEDTFTIVFAEPAEYSSGFSALLPPLGGPLDPTGQGSPLRVGVTEQAPALTQPAQYYVNFTLAAGDPDVVWNHIPLDPVGVGGFSVRMTKDADRPTTTVGGLVPYTIRLENLSPVTIPGISVVDTIPAGFTYVAESATLDGDPAAMSVTGARPITFAGISLAAGQQREIRYLLRAGAGIVRGEYENTATPFVGPAQIGNTDNAVVSVTADPDFEETTIIGKVWNDRDQDGWQDTALATRLQLEVQLEQSVNQRGNTLAALGDNPAIDSGFRLGDGVRIKALGGRYGLADLSADNELKLISTFAEPVKIRQLSLRSHEGTRVLLDGRSGETATAHRGQVRKGLTSQDLQLSYSQRATQAGHELTITITNHGLEEQGLPGVRLATVEGLLIETDAQGRYHIAGVDAGFMERGRNFIVKVDPKTLPEHTEFTTENPRVKRLSQGLMNEFNFGVFLPETAPPQQVMRIKVAEMFFEKNSARMVSAYRPRLRELLNSLDRGTAVTLRIEAVADGRADQARARGLAERRARMLQRQIHKLIDAERQLRVTVEASDTRESVRAGESR